MRQDLAKEAPLHAPQGCTVDRRLRLPPKVPPDHAHRVPEPALTCQSARRVTCDLISAFARTQNWSSDNIRKMPLTCGAPLRNRTVDLLLTMETDRSFLFLVGAWLAYNCS